MIHIATRLFLFVLLGNAMGHTQGVTEDLSEPRGFTFTIAPTLPAFTFKLIPLRKTPDGFGNPQSSIRRIEVFRAGSKVPIQNLVGCDLEGMQPPGEDAEFFSAKDFNFDGYKDIFLETWHGAAGGNWGGCIWLYNLATRKFDYSNEFSKLSGFSLYPKTKTISTISTLGRGGMLGKIHVAEQYAIRKNRPVLIWSQHQDWDDARKKFHCIVKERVGAKMVVVRDEWSDINGEDPPCFP